MNRARIIINPQLLVDVLCLPEGTRIVRIREDVNSFGMQQAQLEMVVEHKDLPLIPEGAVVPIATPRFKSILTRTEFVAWDARDY